MDGRAQSKALFRNKLKEREKKIDSPLIRYNEIDQPVCKVCSVTFKSESRWRTHQLSRNHLEAIKSLKATAAGLTRGSNRNVEPPAELHKTRPASTLPTDFFDNQETKRQKNDMNAEGKIQSVTYPVGSVISDQPHGKREVSPSVGGSFKVPASVKKTTEPAYVQTTELNIRSENKSSTKLGGANAKQVKGALPQNFFDNKEIECQSSSQPRHVPKDIDKSEVQQVMRAPGTLSSMKEKIGSTESNRLSQPSKSLDGSETKQVKGALPEGFFDNKDADLRARGIEPVKVDINDAFKEFEKEIHDDLQEADDRLGEEEIDAAEVREEFDSLEQKVFREQVEMIKKTITELKDVRLAREQKAPAFMGKESSDDSSSDEEEDDDENFAVDWRAKHL